MFRSLNAIGGKPAATSKCLARTLLVGLALFGTGMTLPTGPTTASEAEAPRFSGKLQLVTATASPDTIAPGGTVNFVATLRAAADIKDATVVLAVRRQNSARILDKKIYTGVGIASGNTMQFSWPITAPASTPVGNYKFSILAFDRTGRILSLYARAASASVAVPRLSYQGVNIAGGEIPGVYGEDWIYPQDSDLDYFNGKGLSLIRLPFLWERLQPTLNGELDPIELQRLKDVTTKAAQRRMRIILNVFTKGTYGGQQIGSAAVPVAAYTNFLGRIAAAFSGDEGVYAYSILDEAAGFQGEWPAVAQAAVDAVRTGDDMKLVFIPGECGSRAKSFDTCNAALRISDPSNNFAYAAKVYFSSDDSTNYPQSYDVQQPATTIGADRMAPFVAFLQARGARGYIAEYNIPNDDPRWQPIFEDALKYMVSKCLLGTYWTAGVTTANWRYSIQPYNGSDKPQTQILQKYLMAPSCRTF